MYHQTSPTRTKQTSLADTTITRFMVHRRAIVSLLQMQLYCSTSKALHQVVPSCGFQIPLPWRCLQAMQGCRSIFEGALIKLQRVLLLVLGLYTYHKNNFTKLGSSHRTVEMLPYRFTGLVSRAEESWHRWHRRCQTNHIWLDKMRF